MGAALAFCGASRPCVARADTISVVVDGNPLVFENTAPLDYNDTILVPMRAVFEALAAVVDYTPETQSIHAVYYTSDITLQIGSTTATVNGLEKQLSVPARTHDGSTMVPLRFVSEALGAEVNWNEGDKTVFISTHPDYTAYPRPSYWEGQQLDFYCRVVNIDQGRDILFVVTTDGWINRFHYNHPDQFQLGQTLHLKGSYAQNAITVSDLQPAKSPAGAHWDRLHGTTQPTPAPTATPVAPTSPGTNPPPGSNPSASTAAPPTFDLPLLNPKSDGAEPTSTPTRPPHP